MSELIIGYEEYLQPYKEVQNSTKVSVSIKEGAMKRGKIFYKKPQPFTIKVNGEEVKIDKKDSYAEFPIESTDAEIELLTEKLIVKDFNSWFLCPACSPEGRRSLPIRASLLPSISGDLIYQIICCT